MRAGWKLLRALLHALAGLFTVLFVFPRLQARQRHARVQAWAARMLELLGITLEVRGSPPASGPVLIVSNHISWLDIMVLHAGGHCRFVSKSDVRHWPVIGRLATAAGTLYIERESRRDAMRVVHHMADSLCSDEVLAIFPEGTTSNGVALLPFHANLLQAAITADAPALPVALRYLDARSREPTQRPCYIDDQSLLDSLWRTVSGGRIVAQVSYGEPQKAQGRDRRAWAADLHRVVACLRDDKQSPPQASSPTANRSSCFR